MRLRTATKVLEIAEVKVICENRTEFNGHTLRCAEEAGAMSPDCNALLFIEKPRNQNQIGFLNPEKSHFYGNLKADFLEQALKKITETDALDLSGLQLQPHRNGILEYKTGSFELPYYCDGSLGMLNLPVSSLWCGESQPVNAFPMPEPIEYKESGDEKEEEEEDGPWA